MHWPFFKRNMQLGNSRGLFCGLIIMLDTSWTYFQILDIFIGKEHVHMGDSYRLPSNMSLLHKSIYWTYTLLNTMPQNIGSYNAFEKFWRQREISLQNYRFLFGAEPTCSWSRDHTITRTTINTKLYRPPRYSVMVEWTNPLMTAL
jgi:hypothetical protein